MSNGLYEIIAAQKRGEARGLASICSAHPWVLKAAMSRARNGTAIKDTLKVSENFRAVLIESTCNQVNQFGGYTGFTPAAFVDYVHDLAAGNTFPVDRLILGGDHLGPGPWQNEPAEIAMQKAADMLRDYVQAHYTKLHLDASMHLGDDDPANLLDVELIARRTAWLAQVAESAVSGSGTQPKICYVIGSEVPIPGGAMAHEQSVPVTKVQDARRTLELTQAAFLSLGLDSAWERVIALVVQPGVEFGDDFVLYYNPAAARHLKRFAETIPFVYEAHSTDYQSNQALHQLVQDHFAILKVGPALTFAFREAVFALVLMENELLPPSECSCLVETLDLAMRRDPTDWKGHYHGTERELAFARKYSLSDRIRYYWSDPKVQAALERLLQNLKKKPLPLALVSQWMPGQLEKLRSGEIENTPEALILDKVGSVLDAYAQACG
jgi:D-tagatose-1,6-bisphosphate aldolase subunit GatZ/KbaZ